MYAFLCIGLGVVLGLVRDLGRCRAKETSARKGNVMRDLAVLLKNPAIVAARRDRVLRLSGVLGDLQLLRVSA